MQCVDDGVVLTAFVVDDGARHWVWARHSEDAKDVVIEAHGMTSYEATAAYCDTRARDLLEAERHLAGYGDGEPYKVGLASGIKPALVLNPPAVLIVDREKIPADLWRHPAPPAPEPDKTAIKERLMAQQAVPGCELTRGQRFDWGEPKKRGD